VPARRKALRPSLSDSGDLAARHRVRDWRLALILVGPLYLIGLILVLGAGIAAIRGPSRTAGQLNAAELAFLASAFATLVSATGLWLTKTYNDRAEDRLVLETVATGLNMIGQDGGYAPAAKVAGALATLIHLEHPVIAIRALRAAWLDGAVDAETATWLIGEVLETGTPGSKLEAARLLRSRVEVLTEGRADGSLDLHWPYPLYENWPVTLDIEARIDILQAMVDLLLSRPLRAWRAGDYSPGARGYSWMLPLLDEIIREEPDPVIKGQAAIVAETLLATMPAATQVNWRSNWVAIGPMRERAAVTAAAAMKSGQRLTPFRDVGERLQKWASAASAAAAARSRTPAYQAGERFAARAASFRRSRGSRRRS